MSRVLITGPTGCIGSATVSALFERGADDVYGLSRHADTSRIDPSLRDRITMIQGDIADPSSIQAALETSRPTHIIHLAAFQTPDCQAYPLRGLDINVGGTMHLFKAAAGSEGLERIVFASSAAVYGPRDLYPGETVRPEDPYYPPNLYGFWKTAGEGMAQAFFRETGVATISLRLATTYGPGRDKGFTSAPTTALKAVALNQPYTIPYAGREHYHFVHDVAAGFAGCALDPFEGYGVFNLRGESMENREFLDHVKAVAEDLGLTWPDIRIAENAERLPFVCDLDDSSLLEAFPFMPCTALPEGIAHSLQVFCKMAEQGVLTPAEIA
jgi:nucleoside-diphosphate-sugar epimerase